jgi:hypothetical protein
MMRIVNVLSIKDLREHYHHDGYQKRVQKNYVTLNGVYTEWGQSLNCKVMFDN